VSSSPKPDISGDRTKIAAVRTAWIEAVKDGDVNRLLTNRVLLLAKMTGLPGRDLC